MWPLLQVLPLLRNVRQQRLAHAPVDLALAAVRLHKRRIAGRRLDISSDEKKIQPQPTLRAARETVGRDEAVMQRVTARHCCLPHLGEYAPSAGGRELP